MTFEQSRDFKMYFGPYNRKTLGQVAETSAGVEYLYRARTDEFIRKHYCVFHSAACVFLKGYEAARNVARVVQE